MKVYDIRHTAGCPAGPRLHFVDTFAKLPRAFSRNANSADGPRKIRGKRRHVRGSFIAPALASSDFFRKSVAWFSLAVSEMPCHSIFQLSPRFDIFGKFSLSKAKPTDQSRSQFKWFCVPGRSFRDVTVYASSANTDGRRGWKRVITARAAEYNRKKTESWILRKHEVALVFIRQTLRFAESV